MKMLTVENKLALVTGASSGLGVSFARTLADHGAKIVLAARRTDRLESLADELEKKSGVEALPVRMDVTSPQSVDEALNLVDTRFGRAPDIVVNNAGLSREAWAVEMSEEDWSTVVETNYSSVWRVSKHAANRMIKAQQPGSIINIASITALRTSQFISAYASSKAAVDHLTRQMALELARYNIRVNALAPGYYKTKINEEFLASEQGELMRKRIPMRRFGDHNELSGPLLLLASDAGSYMTGSTIVVDGGHAISPL